MTQASRGCLSTRASPGTSSSLLASQGSQAPVVTQVVSGCLSSRASLWTASSPVPLAPSQASVVAQASAVGQVHDAVQWMDAVGGDHSGREQVLQGGLAQSEDPCSGDKQEALQSDPEANATRAVIDFIAEQHELGLAGQWVDLHTLRSLMLASCVLRAACADEALLSG